jgi:hypothetical protein
MTSPSRTLLDFGAGLLIGLSITVALFAAMDDDGGRLPHDLLLAALAALGLAIVMKFAGRNRARHRRVPPEAGGPRDASTVDTGWMVEGPRGAATEARSGASSSNDRRASRDERTKAALPELKAAHRDAQTSAEGDTRRL